MKQLLSDIQEQLNDEITYLPPRDNSQGSIWIVPDENDIPETTAFPCIGLKDGAITYQTGGGVRLETLMLTVIAYVNIPSQESSMIGEGSEKGVLDVMADIKDALDGWLPTGCYAADMLSEAGSVRMIKMDPNVSQEQWPTVQKKSATFRYQREVAI